MPKLAPARQLRILDFDIENRPITYGGPDWTFADITAIAASFEGEDQVYTWLLGEVPQKLMLLGFLSLYDQADIVTGHYIRRHDLPHINDALLELGLPALSKKLASDTKTDLLQGRGLSKSQEALSAMFGLEAPKVHMTQQDWREANRLTPEGLAKTRARVEGDIRQHKQLRQALLERDWLAPPSLWTPRR